ncbi:MAG: MmcQ/YjbR family DNA-binding protein [Gemmatimonadetes bacterium]|nr:MmcQ/YjbR family DNA-binding protein [Gemmatimonadota bacterium]MCC6771953.1 MmcQ/YjbR family DNA-binding protein [Gemmatimonadaceae bacterium]
MPRRRLTQDDVRRIALSLPEAHEGAHMGHADLRVRNKIFASLPNDPATVAMKVTPANLDALVRENPGTYRDVWGGRWLGVTLATVSVETLQTLLEDAWTLTAPKSLVRAHTAADR